MKKYQIIPRKFRPTRFYEVAGHENIVQTLKNAITMGRVGQAYLFSGCRGCGKTTIARLFAKSLNCDQKSPECEPCNDCPSCLEIAIGQNLDVIEIDGASNRGIDDIRRLTETVGYAPHQGRYKIYLIDEVHMLTKEAFNALLKTLEEPPERVKFFFATTEPHKIPPTILSRCQRFHLGRVPPEAIIAKLSEIATTLEIEVEKEALVQISTLAEGSLRDAQSLLDQLITFGKAPLTLEMTRELFGLVSHATLCSLDEAILSQNFSHAVELAHVMYQSGKDPSALVDSLLEHFRMHLTTHLGAISSSVYTSSRYAKMQCLALLDAVIEWNQMMQKTLFKKLHLEILFLDLVRKAHQVSLDALIQRLVDLEGRCKQADIAQIVQAPPSSVEPTTPAFKEPEQMREKKESPKDVTPAPIRTCTYDNLIRFTAVELEGFVKTK